MKNFLPKSKSNPSGFTLIELMVVISIIAFLAVIGIAAYSNAQKTARDGRRKADIDAISQAMESAYNSTSGAYTITSANTWTQANFGTSFSSGQIPVDPSAGSSTCLTHACTYTVVATNTNKGFSACAALEVSTGNASAMNGGTNGQPTYTSDNAQPYYCKSSQQAQ